MREKTQGAILNFEMCPNCFTIDKDCRCTGVNAKYTTRNKNGFRDGVKPPDPPRRRNN